jgi:hypothetical protein
MQLVLVKRDKDVMLKDIGKTRGDGLLYLDPSDDDTEFRRQTAQVTFRFPTCTTTLGSSAQLRKRR